MRVLLVHANPFHRVLAASPDTLEQLRSRSGDLAETRIADPFQAGDWRANIDDALANFRPDLIGFGVRAIEDVVSLLPEVRALRDRVGTLAPGVPIVAGATTTPDIASALLAHLEISWSIADDLAFRHLVERASRGLDWRGVAGVIRATPSGRGSHTTFGGAFLALAVD